MSTRKKERQGNFSFLLTSDPGFCIFLPIILPKASLIISRIIGSNEIHVPCRLTGELRYCLLKACWQKKTFAGRKNSDKEKNHDSSSFSDFLNHCRTDKDRTGDS